VVVVVVVVMKYEFKICQLFGHFSNIPADDVGTADVLNDFI
jgi:hypothetical protein